MRGEHLEYSMASVKEQREEALRVLARVKKLEAEREELVKRGLMRKIITKVKNNTFIKYEYI